MYKEVFLRGGVIGNTQGSGPWYPGSNPGPAAKKSPKDFLLRALFLVPTYED